MISLLYTGATGRQPLGDGGQQAGGLGFVACLTVMVTVYVLLVAVGVVAYIVCVFFGVPAAPVFFQSMAVLSAGSGQNSPRAYSRYDPVQLWA